MVYDVAVIGAGIVGTAIARDLAMHGVRVIVVERESDIGEGTSKANSGIIHSGFDAHPGSLEAELLASARAQWDAILDEYPIPSARTGALMLALTDEDLARFAAIEANAYANAVAVERWPAGRVLDRVPVANPMVRSGLWIAAERVIDPFQAVRALAEAAVNAGAAIKLDAEVVRISPGSQAVEVTLRSGETLTARFVVNAAGLWADEVARLFGDTSFRLTPRKGQFIVCEETLGIDVILLPVPTPLSKGILVTPIAFGGLLLGPTAEDQSDKGDRTTTTSGLRLVREGAARLVPDVEGLPSVRQFAGVRAVYPPGDYYITPSAIDRRVLHVAGIRSTGVSAAPAIATFVRRKLTDQGLGLSQRRSVAVPPLTFGSDEPGGGEVVCLCRDVSWGEVRAALDRVPRPGTLDAIKRRTGALLGECQGAQCIPRLLEKLSDAWGVAPSSIRKNTAGSELIVRQWPVRREDPPRDQATAVAVRPRQWDVVVVGLGHTGDAVLRRLLEAGVKACGVDWAVLSAAPNRYGLTTAIALSQGPHGGWSVLVSAPDGPHDLEARAVVLATGTTELPRESARIPGSRPVGVMTPGLVLALAGHGWVPAERPLVWVSGATDARAAAALRAMGAYVRERGPACGDSRIVSVEGWPRVERVWIEDAAGGITPYDCDGLVYALGRAPRTRLVPDHAPGKAIVVDAGGRTEHPGLYATGTCVLPDPNHEYCLQLAAITSDTVIEDLATGQGWAHENMRVGLSVDGSESVVIVPGLLPKGRTGHDALLLATEDVHVTIMRGATIQQTFMVTAGKAFHIPEIPVDARVQVSLAKSSA